jgi:hypothetical protein
MANQFSSTLPIFLRYFVRPKIEWVTNYKKRQGKRKRTYVWPKWRFSFRLGRLRRRQPSASRRFDLLASVRASRWGNVEGRVVRREEGWAWDYLKSTNKININNVTCWGSNDLQRKIKAQASCAFIFPFFHLRIHVTVDMTTPPPPTTTTTTNDGKSSFGLKVIASHT